MTSVRDLRAILFVPGNRPDRFGKALASGAPAIVLDLEDAVAPAEKAKARGSVLEWFAQQPRDGAVAAGVRVNHCATRHGIHDLAALVEHARRPDFILLPKVESPFEVTLAARLMPEVPLLCTIESAIGLHAAFDIARASPSVAGLGFGGADLAADLRAEMSWDALYHARGTVVQAAASVAAAVLDVPYLNLASDDGLREECLRAKAMGFTGKFAIHPRHVAGIVSAFAPSPAEIERARKILRAAEEAAGNAGRAGDSMIDEALLRSARRIVAAAGSDQGV
jgi:citrate lyase beta subunit